MFFTNTCSWLLHLTQVFYSVVTFAVRPFLRILTKITFIPATHTHTSYPTPGLIILFNTYHNLTCHVIYSFIMLIVFFSSLDCKLHHSGGFCLLGISLLMFIIHFRKTHVKMLTGNLFPIITSGGKTCDALFVNPRPITNFPTCN